ANVAPPWIRSQKLHALLADGPDLLPRLARIAVDEILDEDRDILLPFTERWNVDREHVEPIEEIASKSPGVDGRLQVAIRGRDHADIGVNGLSSTDALELALLEHPQQGDLGLRR